MFRELPRFFFLVNGTSEGYSSLNAFDGALLQSGVGNTNLIKMSSILPPGVRLIDPVAPPPGIFLPIAYAAITSAQEGELIAAAVAAALPEDESKPGLIMEYSCPGPAEEVEAQVKRMAEEGMKMRGEAIKEIYSAVAEHRVHRTGAAFAGVVLWG